MKKKSIQSSSFFKANQHEILQRWSEDIESHSQFSKQQPHHINQVLSNAKPLYHQLLKTLEDTPLPDISTDAFKPFFRIWHQVLQDQIAQGISTKDTALLIFTLKKTV